MAKDSVHSADCGPSGGGGWKRSLPDTCDGQGEPLKSWSAVEVHGVSQPFDAKPGARRSPMSEQMCVILKVGLQPTARHEPGNAGEG